MTWIPVLMVALAGFFGAGSVSMWRTGHRGASGLLAAITLLCVAIGIVALIPGSGDG